MRRITTLAILLSLVCASCSTPEKEVRKTAQKYLQAMGDYEFDDAWDYATPETQNSTLKLFRDVIMPGTDMNYVNSNRPATISITKVEITNDTTATVDFHKVTPIQEMDGTIELRLRDGDWYVHQPIEIPDELQGPQTHTYTHTDRDTANLQVLKK